MSRIFLKFGIWNFFGAWCLVLGIFSPVSLFLGSARAESVEETWLFRNEGDIRDWHYAGLEDGILTADGLQFSVKGQAVLFRATPPGFDRNVDGLWISLDPSTLEEAALLLMEVGEGEKVLRRLRIALHPGEDSLHPGLYIPLTLYRLDMVGTNTLALSLKGEADRVTFGGVRLLRYSLWEKLRGAWQSFWILEPFRPHMINVLIGPVIVPDPVSFSPTREILPLRISVNAYILLLFILLGIALFLYAALLAWVRGLSWSTLRRRMLTRFLLCIAVAWVFYDFRMSTEFFRAVAIDAEQYKSVPPESRTFRDLDRFYDFALFTQDLVSDREQYEIFAPDSWQYFGLLQYYTYPALPNDGEPVSDTWVVYARPDITLGEDARLYHAGEAFTQPGILLGRFDASSFVFREHGS